VSFSSTGSHECVDCAVVIVTYNSADDIDSLLDSLPAAADGLTMRIVVVDNGSTDATVRLVHGHRDVLCVEAGANLGYAGGINLGRNNAGKYSSLLVLNPDIVLEPGALREMFAELGASAAGMTVPMLLDANGGRYLSLRREPTLARAIGDGLFGSHLGWRPGWLSEIVRRDQDYTYRHAIDWATGAVMLISADCDGAVGCWDERFFLYSEEVDYAARARAAGFRIYYLPNARARHRGGGSGRTDILTALMAVNRIRYMEKRGRWPRAYRAAVVFHELLRFGNRGHRLALSAVLQPSKWSALPGGSRNRPTVASARVVRDQL
jgi:GT2 family glycosyltransferase